MLALRAAIPVSGIKNVLRLNEKEWLHGQALESCNIAWTDIPWPVSNGRLLDALQDLNQRFLHV